MWSYYLMPIIYYVSQRTIALYWENLNGIKLHFFSVCISYLPTYLQTTKWGFKDGYRLPWFQQHWIWDYLVSKVFSKASVSLEETLNPSQQYIFCAFPHGTCSVNHFLTMTDSRKMLTQHYTGERRDLVATILLFIPVIKDLLLFLGCVDAGMRTASHNLKKNRSLFIYIGGEKEQLMTSYGEQKIYVNNRKGFIKLALLHGAHLVPMYAFGENESYFTSNLFLELRKWLQSNFHLGIPICYGRFGTAIPNKVGLHVEIGKPIKVDKIPSEEITSEKIDALHQTFVEEMTRLYNRTKVKYPEYEKSELLIH